MEEERLIKRHKVDFGTRLLKMCHLALSVFLFYCAWVAFYTKNRVVFDHKYSLFILVIYAVLLLFFARIYNAYDVEYARISDLVYSQTLGEIISVVCVYALVTIAWHHFYNFFPVLWLVIAQIIFNCLWCKLAHEWLYRNTPKYRTVVIYRNESDRRKIKDVEKFYRRFEVIETLKNPQNIREVQESIVNCDAVIVAGVEATLRNGIVKQCVEDNKQCFFAPHIGDIIVSTAKYEEAFSSPIMSVRQEHMRLEYAFVKRIMDIIVSLIAIIILSPLMLITAFAIFMYDKHAPIYKQVRLTKNRKEFKIYKFRSMRIDAEADGKARLATENDDRITPVGKIIRACRLDELPQLFNILKGDMTIVGPRPERPEIAEEYEKDLPAFKMRLKVKAGLTGYAQIYGKYNTNPYEKLEMDLLYISKMSILTDMMLIFATVKILFIKDSTEGIDSDKTIASK